MPWQVLLRAQVYNTNLSVRSVIVPYKLRWLAYYMLLNTTGTAQGWNSTGDRLVGETDM